MNLISVKTAAKLKGVTVQTIRYWIKTGKVKLRMSNPHLVNRSDIEAITVIATGRPKQVQE